jgi:hypothetical protein
MLDEGTIKEEETIIKDVFDWGRGYMRPLKSAREVITKRFLELFPKNIWPRQFAMFQYDCKEMSETVTGTHCRCLKQAVTPFVIILQKASCQAGVIKCQIEYTIKRTKVVKSKWSLYSDE